MPDNRYLDTLTVFDPSLLSSVHHSSSKPANQYGFPQPSEQCLSPTAATAKYYFADETKWRAILEYGDFDDIVIGTGFCALAYIDKALQLNPRRRILVLERGGLWLMSHFQNLPMPFNLLLNNASETCPWGLTSSTFHSDIKFVQGCSPFFGGRSPFWSAWSPQPPLGLMRDFPKSLLATAGEDQFWKNSRDLLNVVEPDQLYGGEYQALQKYIGERLSEAISPEFGEKTIDTIQYAEPANLAVGKTTRVSKLAFEKFSTPGPLLKLYERQRRLAKKGEGSPLTIATDVVVERFEIDPLDPGKRTNVLHTSRGALSFSLPKKPNLILATGAIPACTIVLNSVPKQYGRAGSRLSGNFVCHINARFPLPERFRTLREAEWQGRKNKGAADREQELDDALGIAAYYLAGRDPKTGLQYHGEVTVIHSPLAEEQREDAARLCPDFYSSPTEAQLEGSQNHVIVACVLFGEIDETNSERRIRFNKERANKTTNVDLQLTLSEGDKKLREVMYKTALQAIDAMAGDETSYIEYWHDDGYGSGKWDKSEPDKIQFQKHGFVHEASTLYMDDALPLHPSLEPEESSSSSQPSVDRNYRVYGTGNVYTTGSAIFPTSGSWNPTLTMCGFAQDLAVKLHRRSIFRQIFTLSITSDQVHRLAGTTENLLNAHRRRVSDTLAFLNPRGLPSGKRGVWQLVWGPVIWKNGTDTSATGPDLSWYAAYHDNLEFEDGSLHPTFVVAVSGTSPRSIHKVVDFNTYVSDGQFKTQPAEASMDTLDINKAYIILPIARAVQTLLTTSAPSAAGTRTLLHFINGVKSTKDPITRTLPRFIFTGHGVGGAIASSAALALVSGGVVSAERTLTYSTAGPSPGNVIFAHLLEKTFKARVTGGAEGWNINLVNTLDVVPQAWCYQRYVSPSQNLSNIPVIYGAPMVPDVIRTTDVLIANASELGVVLKPLPGRYFTPTPPSAPPASLDEFLQMAVQQHVPAYLREIGITVPGADFYQGGLVAKAEVDIRLNYPVIHDLEQAHRGEDRALSRNGSRNDSWAVERAGPVANGTESRTGFGSWIGSKFGIGSGNKNESGNGDGIRTGARGELDIGTTNGNGTGNGVEARASNGAGNGPSNGAGTPTGTGTWAIVENGSGTGRVAVTPLSTLTVVKYGNPEYNLIPQSTQNHPVLVYRSCFPDSTSVSEVKSHLQSVAVVEPHRTGTLLIRDHYYTTTHKVLCITWGQAQLRFGGEGNPDRVDVDVRKGDVVIIPAGVPHRLLKDIGRDLEIVESYPKGTNVDADSRRLGSRPQQTHLFIVAALAWFARDPIYGDTGPVIGC